MVIYSKRSSRIDLRSKQAIKSPAPPEFGLGGDKFDRHSKSDIDRTPTEAGASAFHESSIALD